MLPVSPESIECRSRLHVPAGRRRRAGRGTRARRGSSPASSCSTPCTPSAPTACGSATCSRAERRRVGEARGARSEVSVAANEQFIVQDSVGTAMYVIAAGRVMVYRRTEDGEEIPLGAAWPGETIGEMGYFSDGTRSASRARWKPCSSWRSRTTTCRSCFELVPNLARDFLKVVTKRLRETTSATRPTSTSAASSSARCVTSAHTSTCRPTWPSAPASKTSSTAS